MSGAADKARFYQEQSVPELQELERKKIFTRQEITSIAKRRSDFEHKINARGSTSSDFARYAEYEMNLESLRRKRVKRLGVKATNYTGPRRIFFVLDRATRKFHGDVGLWMQYLSFARKQKSNKKVAEILTRVLRLHPTKAELWIYAADYTMEERGDMTEARSYMQRGLRFCAGAQELWLEYARLEMIYIAKIVGRRRILGLDQVEGTKKSGRQENGDIDGDMVALPAITAEDINPEERQDEAADQEALKKLTTSPALSGAIPMAVFDAAMKQFDSEAKFAERFFDTIAEFTDVPCQRQILGHILDSLRSEGSESPSILIRFVRQPVIGIEANSADFPAALGTALDRLKLAPERLKDTLSRRVLHHQVLEWILSYLDAEELDPDLKRVLLATLKRTWREYQSAVGQNPDGCSMDVAGVLKLLEARGQKQLADCATIWASSMWPEQSQVVSLRGGEQ